ncbi:MAG TPA: hypothetical protein VHZ03_47690 [Trebonia sp.]|jgi:hypothetical protein|nr:hypothetical protein [Trebonia sp.]
MDYRGLIKSLSLPAGYTPPAELAYEDIRARAISRADLNDDVRGINASLELIRRTRGGAWPEEAVSENFNYVDLVWHELEFRDGTSLTYAVYDTEKQYLGCCYLYPMGRRTPLTQKLLEHDVDVSWWVTPDAYQRGFYFKLYRALQAWSGEAFPFRNPYYSNREIPGHQPSRAVGVPVNVDAAEQFVYGSARLLDRHRLANLRHQAPSGPVLEALRAYRNPDGGFGHALEPDVRAPGSEPAATLHALEVLAEVGALEDPMATAAAAWVGTIARPDGGVPFVLPASGPYPHAPWMIAADEASHLTFALAAMLWTANSAEPWLQQATEWCWAKLAHPERLDGWWVKFALDFLDAVPDGERAAAAIQELRPLIAADGSIPVPGGTEDERLTALTLAPRPAGRSRALFTDDQISADLDRLEQGQQDDGGWIFDWLAWSPGQSVEWRGILTLRVLTTLALHGRIELPAGERHDR